MNLLYSASLNQQVAVTACEIRLECMLEVHFHGKRTITRPSPERGCGLQDCGTSRYLGTLISITQTLFTDNFRHLNIDAGCGTH
jgi:hypothetical protein